METFEILNQQLITAIGWSIFHILWQGFIIAIILSGVLYLLRNKSAQLRYIISIISLIFLLTCSLYNFKNNYDKSVVDTTIRSDYVLLKEQPGFKEIKVTTSNNNYVQNQINTLKQFVYDVDKYFPIIVKFWLVGVLLFSLKMIFGFIYTNRLRRFKGERINNKWLQKFNTLELKLQVNRKIQYFESLLAKTPMVLGYFKPMILIPTGMLTGIPENQIEAIIAHEIAHIRRNDYIINVIQTLIETILFFHPAVWYISSRIRTERENSCDDIALTVCDDSLVYAKALVSVQDLSLGKYYAAVAFSGKKKLLLNRIKRMIMKPKTKTNFTDKIIAALIILSAAFAVSFTYTNTGNTNYFNEKEIVKREMNQVVQTKSEKNKILLNSSIVRDTVRVMKEIEQLDMEKIQLEIEKAIQNVDMKDIEKEIQMAFEQAKSIDVEEIMREVEMNMEKLEDMHLDMDNIYLNLELDHIDMEEIRREIENARERMKNEIDNEAIQKEMQKVQEELSKIDRETLRLQMEKTYEHFNESEKQKTLQDLDTKLKKLEELELEEN